MSALDPSAPSQPSQQTGLNQAGNPAAKTTEEKASAADKSSTSGSTIDTRSAHDVPSKHGEEATASSLGYGDSGPLKEKDIGQSDAAHKYSKDGNLEGEQMRAPGEGDVAQAVKQGGGGGHAEQESLTQDMDAKADRHEQILHERGQRTGQEIEEEGKEDWTGKQADVAEALGGRGNGIVLAADT